ncbi:MAG: hypothetical protein JRF63_11945 [Deltaproteobacteria bacterium]|nr:hypothetical protein [Deltaproteobacteria bacterium]
MPRVDSPSNDNGDLISPAAIDRWPRGVSCEGGFRLLGTPLGFTGSSNPGLLFIANVDDPAPRINQRILATPFAAAAIGSEKRDLDALTLGFGRKIRLGRMDISLVPAGLDPGSAQLEIGFKDRRIVYCGGVRLKAPLFAPQIEITPCDLLLLDSVPAEPRPGSPKRVAAKLGSWISAQLDAGRGPSVVCGSGGAALDVAWTLSRLDVPTRACRPLFEMIRRVERYGLPFPHLRRLEQSFPGSGVLLHLDRLWPSGRRRGPVAYAGPGREQPTWADVAFRLGESEDRPGLVAYVKETGASKVALGPRCDETTATMLANAGVSVHRVGHPTQIPLPL